MFQKLSSSAKRSKIYIWCQPEGPGKGKSTCTDNADNESEYRTFDTSRLELVL